MKSVFFIFRLYGSAIFTPTLHLAVWKGTTSATSLVMTSHRPAAEARCDDLNSLWRFSLSHTAELRYQIWSCVDYHRKANSTSVYCLCCCDVLLLSVPDRSSPGLDLCCIQTRSQISHGSCVFLLLMCFNAPAVRASILTHYHIRARRCFSLFVPFSGSVKLPGQRWTGPQIVIRVELSQDVFFCTGWARR